VRGAVDVCQSARVPWSWEGGGETRSKREGAEHQVALRALEPAPATCIRLVTTPPLARL
jgi:hypothetical protein